jgi:hypothetical protein
MEQPAENVQRLYGQSIAGVPCLIMEPDTPQVRRRTVLVLHGLRGSKERMLPTAWAFAQAGYRAIALDCRMHNGREGTSERDTLLERDLVGTMRAILTETSTDISRILDALGVADTAIHGVSMGGYIVFTALLAEQRLAAATIAMGSPDWLTPLPDLGFGPDTDTYRDIARSQPLELAPASYPPRPLLMLHGDLDDLVPVRGVEALYAKLLPYYADHPERLGLHIYPGAGHQYTDDMVAQSVRFTSQFYEP